MKSTIYTLTTDNDAGLNTEVFTTAEARDAAAWQLIWTYYHEDPEGLERLKAKHPSPRDAWEEMAEQPGFVDSMSLGRHDVEVADPAPALLQALERANQQLEELLDDDAAGITFTQGADIERIQDGMAKAIEAAKTATASAPAPVSAETETPTAEDAEGGDRVLPPDPEGRNDERAAWAATALRAFMNATRTDPGDAICDLITDLKHLCDREPELYGKFEDALRRGTYHYEEETTAIEGEA